MENNTNEIPVITYPYSVKLDPTAEGFRIGVHVYTFKAEEIKPMLKAAFDAAEDYIKSTNKLVAPMKPKEVKENKAK